MAKEAAFDEMRGVEGVLRPLYARVADWLERTPADVLANRCQEAEAFFRRIGITFAVYGDAEEAERLIPFDIIPRLISGPEWAHLARGLEQRVKALNAFIADVYGKQEIVKAGLVPEDLVFGNPAFQPAMTQIEPPGGVYVHIAGIDIVRADATNSGKSRSIASRFSIM